MNGENIPRGRGRESISVRVYFWPIKNPATGKRVPKQGWAGGQVVLEPSDVHGLKASGKMFHSIDLLVQKLHELLAENGVTLIMDVQGARVPRLGAGYPLRRAY